DDGRQGAGGDRRAADRRRHAREFLIMRTYQNFIAGQDVAAADGRTFTGFNPTTGGVWGTFALAGPADVDRAVKAASDAFRTGPWGKLSPTRRGRLLMKWGDAIADDADRIAPIET